jgi:hypothetical protein
MAEKKTLAQLVGDRTFLARRHGDLLELSPLVDDPDLRLLQIAYRAEESQLERQAAALRFEKLVRAVERVELTLRQGLLGGLGPACVLDGLPAEQLEQLEEKWERWERRGDGFNWRVLHGQMHNLDVQRAYRRLTGRRETNLVEIHNRFPDLAVDARMLLPRRRPPNPPGWAFVDSRNG